MNLSLLERVDSQEELKIIIFVLYLKLHEEMRLSRINESRTGGTSATKVLNHAKLGGRQMKSQN